MDPMDTHTEHEHQEGDTYVCEECGMTFASEEEMMAHSHDDEDTGMEEEE